MTNLLIKLFVKDSKNTSDPAVRKRYGYLGAFTGIVLNILLFLGKLIAGILSGGISVIADAFNNLSDAGSSIMTFVGFKMAGMPADSEHPYGHGRMEYVSGIIISFIIMMMGFELGKSSVEKIFSPEKSEFSILAVSVLGASLLVKLWMALFNTKLGRKIDSATMKAAAADSLSDCISTSVVIICMFIQLFSGFELDSYAGIIVALFIHNYRIHMYRNTASVLFPEIVLYKIYKLVCKHYICFTAYFGMERYYHSAYTLIMHHKIVYALLSTISALPTVFQG